MISPADRGRLFQFGVGEQLPALTRGPITRGMLALFAGASNDHALLHIDTDYVREAGMPDVFVHGMLTMAYLGHLLTSLVRQEDVLEWNVRFVAITPVLATVTGSGEVMAISVTGGEQRARLRLKARTDTGSVVASGEALIAMASPAREGPTSAISALLSRPT